MATSFCLKFQQRWIVMGCFMFCPEQQRPSSGILRKMELMLQKKMQSTVQTLSSEATFSKSARPTLFAPKIDMSPGPRVASTATHQLSEELWSIAPWNLWNVGKSGLKSQSLWDFVGFQCGFISLWSLFDECMYTVYSWWTVWNIWCHIIWIIYMCKMIFICGFTTFCSLMDIICGQANGWSNFYELTEDVRQPSIGSRCPISQTARPEQCSAGSLWLFQQQSYWKRNCQSILPTKMICYLPDLTCEGFSHAWRSIWRSRPGIAKAF